VRQRHVARAEIVVGLDERQIVPDHPAVFDADPGDQLARIVNAHRVVRRVRDLDEIRVHLLGHAVDGGEFVHRTFFGDGISAVRTRALADVDGEDAMS
jgi:hypothetical protein